MNLWEKTYLEGFKISSKKPSEIIKEIPLTNKKSNILDIGCGEGRNSIYFAKKNHYVQCIDVVDSLPNMFKKNKNICYKKISAKKYNYTKNYYDIVLMLRLIQYIPLTDLKNIFKKIYVSLKKNGFLAISYTCSGGIFLQNYSTKKYSHKLYKILKILDKIEFKISFIRKGSNKSKHVPYTTNIESYDIVLNK